MNDKEDKIKELIKDHSSGNGDRLCDYIIENDIDIEEILPNMGNMLNYAILKGSKDSVSTIIHFGANFNEPVISDGTIPFKNMIYSGRLELIPLLTGLFWSDYFHEALLSCYETKNTKILVSIINEAEKENKELKKSLSNKDLKHLTFMLFYSALRNELENMKTFIRLGADPYFKIDGVNLLAILKYNGFNSSYEYFSQNYPKMEETKIVEKDDINIKEFIKSYKNRQVIDDLSFVIAKYGSSMLLEKDDNDEMLIEVIMENGLSGFFLRLFRTLNDRSEALIGRLIEKAKKADDKKLENKKTLIEILIEESIQ